MKPTFHSDFGLRTSDFQRGAHCVRVCSWFSSPRWPVAPSARTTSVPRVDTPAAYRTAASDTNAPAGTNSFADLGWWQVFQDPQLTAYIGEALTNNWDIKIAAARVLQAEAALRVTRSQFFPTVNAGGDLVTTRASENGPSPIPVRRESRSGSYGDVFASMSAYEVDLWGKIRRANEAARAQLLATEDAQQTVRQTLVAQVATAYLDLLELDYELEIAQRTYAVRTNSLALTAAREEGGVAAMQDVAQAKILVYGAEASIVDIQRQREQQENALCILLGRNPGSIQRGEGFAAPEGPRRSARPVCPRRCSSAARTSELAEQQLVAANADIGQAKAAFYPAAHPHRLLRLPDRGALRPVHRARRGRGSSARRSRCRCSPAAPARPT